MNIVHIVRQFHPAVGGFEDVVKQLALAQAAAGHTVRVVTLNRLFKGSAETLPAREVIDGIEVIRIPYFGSTRYPIAFSVIKFIRDADIVHVHAIDFFFDYLAWTKLFHRKRLVVSTHGGFFHTPFAARLKRLYFRTVTRMSLAWYNATVVVSVNDQALFETIRKSGIVCIENGIDTSKYRDAASQYPTKSILALGRLASNKRLDRLLAFFAALRSKDPQWKLTIAGRPWDVEAAHLISRAETLKLGDAVDIVQAPSETDIRDLMAGSSVIASASEYEGFGLSAVEGMSAGLFPLLSDIAPFRRLVARSGIGINADFSDPEAAADKWISTWQKIEADYGRYRQKSIKAASEYDWKPVSKAYAKVYEDICGTRTRNILGVPISVNTASQVADLLDARFERGEHAIVAFANANLLNIASRDSHFRTALQKFVVFNDGIGVDIASIVLYGSAFPENLNGTDFTPYYLQNTRQRYRIFLLGSQPGIPERASDYFVKHFRKHSVVGYHHGFFAKEETANIVGMIKKSRADIVLVGMGNPQQELWLEDNLGATGCRLAFGVGALFDFITGNVPRAPLWIRSARIEWLHRLVMEPKRLWRRYLVGNFLFLCRVFGQRISGVGVAVDQ